MVTTLAIGPGERPSLDFKRSEVGEIPTDWDAKQLFSLSDMKSGEGITARLIDEYSPYPCFGGNGLRGYTNTFTHDGTYVLIGRQGALCGNVNLATGKFFASEHAIVVTPKSKTSVRWLGYVLTSLNLNRYSESSAQPGLSVDKIKKLTVPTPPTKVEQEAIAEALSDADALIESLEALVAKKRAIKHGAMQDLLSGRKRLPGFSGEWKVSTLGAACRTIVDGTHFTPKYVEAGVPFYSVENVTANDFSDTKYISLDEHRLLTRRCKPEKRDILLTRIGAIGDARLIDWDVDASIYVSLALLKCGELVHPEFLAAYMTSAEFRKGIEDRSLLNASPKKINMIDIGKVPIPLPEKSEQQAIAAIYGDTVAEIDALQAKLAKARHVKQGMMQELLTGRVRLV